MGKAKSKRLLGSIVAVIAASWGCGPAPSLAAQQAVWKLDRSALITYFISEGEPGSGFREGDRTFARWALEAWAREANPPLTLAEGPEASATIRVYWVPAAGGLYGEMRRRTVDGRLAADVYILPDTEGLGPDIAAAARLDPLFRDTIVYLTCVHELGHAFGLAHTSAFPDIMYSFQYGGDIVAYFMRFRYKLTVRDDIRTASPFSAADEGTFRALYP
jgi:Matrixin